MIPTPPSTSSIKHSIWPFLHSWWWSGLGALIFLATVATGLFITSVGPRLAELGVDIWLAQDRVPALVAVSLAIHYILGPVGAVCLVVIICLGLFIFKRSLVPVGAFAWVVGIGWLFATLGKRLVGRARPPADAVQVLVTERGMNSFPSGHTAFAVALVWAFVLVIAQTRRARIVTISAGAAFVALVAFSRIYLGAHYPSDVIASVFISSATIVASIPLWNKLIEPRIKAVTSAKQTP